MPIARRCPLRRSVQAEACSGLDVGSFGQAFPEMAGVQGESRADFQGGVGFAVIAAGYGHAGVVEPPGGAAVEVAAFRIIQESLTNVARHAEVGDASVAIRMEAGVLHVRVEDRGRGTILADNRDPGSPQSAGMLGMRERALAIGGSFDVSSEPGQGMTVLAELPVNSG